MTHYHCLRHVCTEMLVSFDTGGSHLLLSCVCLRSSRWRHFGPPLPPVTYTQTTIDPIGESTFLISSVSIVRRWRGSVWCQLVTSTSLLRSPDSPNVCVCVQFGSLQAINDAMFEKGRVDIYSLYSCAVFSSSFNLVRLLQRGQGS